MKKNPHRISHNTQNLKNNHQDKTPTRSIGNEPKILIYSAQRNKGLAAALANSRCNNKHRPYEISATIKTNALTKDIISGIRPHLQPCDKVIISVGENDSSPKQTLELLKKALHALRECSVIVLQVKNVNSHINTYKLNSNIENLCNQYINCRFLALNQSLPDTYYIKNTCKKINVLIDSIDHDRNSGWTQNYTTSADSTPKITYSTSFKEDSITEESEFFRAQRLENIVC
ncbi:hypothetical protein O0L34_g4463 [Tuta absoluta]|nr:hypothetical protein O0L34_g4463 [Tuta absoluta]